MEYGVQNSELTNTIWAGRISQDGRSFTSKSDVTSQVIGAIEDHVRGAYAGSAYFTRTHGDTATTVHIDIEEHPAGTPARDTTPHKVTTEAERDELPAGVIVLSADGTIACRHHSGVGVVFGDERPFPWEVLALPLTLIPIPADSPTSGSSTRADRIKGGGHR